MEKEMKMAGKAYQAPVMQSVTVELQSMVAGTSPIDQCTCSIGIGYGGGCSGVSGRSREANSWDED